MRAKEGGKETSHGPLRFITGHSFRARLCRAKNEAPEEEAGTDPWWMKWRLAFLFFVQHGRDFEIVCSSFEASESLLKVAYQELFIDKKKKQ